MPHRDTHPKLPRGLAQLVSISKDGALGFACLVQSIDPAAIHGRKSARHEAFAKYTGTYSFAKNKGYFGCKQQAYLEVSFHVTSSPLMNGRELTLPSICSLPPVKATVVKLCLSETERRFYGALHKKAKKEFNAYLKDGVVMHNYSNILELLLRLRQACSHPFLVLNGIDWDKWHGLNRLADYDPEDENGLKSGSLLGSGTQTPKADTIPFYKAHLSKTYVESTKVRAILQHILKFYSTVSFAVSDV